MRLVGSLAIAFAAVLSGCGGNVVVDGASSGGGHGTGGSSAASPGSGTGSTGAGLKGHQACAMESCTIDTERCLCRGNCRDHRYRTDCSVSGQQCTCIEDEQVVGTCQEDDDSCGNCCVAFFH